jgi:hypothetical protein
LDKPVIEKKFVAGFHNLGERFKAHRNPLRITDNIIRSQGKHVPCLELNGLRSYGTQPHFGTGEIRHNRNFFSGDLFCLTDSANHSAVGRKVAVGKVKPGNIHARVDQALQHLS